VYPGGHDQGSGKDGRDAPETHREPSRDGVSPVEVRRREGELFRFLRAEDVPPGQFAPPHVPSLPPGFTSLLLEHNKYVDMWRGEG
jgi:hypothetical protein